MTGSKVELVEEEKVTVYLELCHLVALAASAVQPKSMSNLTFLPMSPEESSMSERGRSASKSPQTPVERQFNEAGGPRPATRTGRSER